MNHIITLKELKEQLGVLREFNQGTTDCKRGHSCESYLILLSGKAIRIAGPWNLLSKIRIARLEPNTAMYLIN
jgi:hypothetical protein